MRKARKRKLHRYNRQVAAHDERIRYCSTCRRFDWCLERSRDIRCIDYEETSTNSVSYDAEKKARGDTYGSSKRS